MNKFASYDRHDTDVPAGHIYLDKDKDWGIDLRGAEDMTQEELDGYAKVMVTALNVCFKIVNEKEVDDRDQRYEYGVCLDEVEDED